LLDQYGDHCLCILAVKLYEHRKSGLTLHERCNMCVSRASDQIAIPVPRDGSILDRRWAFVDRNSINDPATRLALRRKLLAVTHYAPGAQVFHQLLF